MAAVARDKTVINQSVRDFAPRGPGRLAAAIDVDWLKGPVRRELTPSGDTVLICRACEDRSPHESYRPGPVYRELSQQYLAVRDVDGLVEFVERWGMIAPQGVLGGAPNPRHVGAGTVELAWVSTFSIGTARVAARYAVGEAASVVGDVAQFETDRRIEFAGVQTMLSGLGVRFSDLDEPWAVRFVPTTLHQVVAIALLAMFRGGLPLSCGVCGRALPEQTGPGRPRWYCSDSCANRAAYNKRIQRRNQMAATIGHRPIAIATSGHVPSVSPSRRRKYTDVTASEL